MAIHFPGPVEESLLAVSSHAEAERDEMYTWHGYQIRLSWRGEGIGGPWPRSRRSLLRSRIVSLEQEEGRGDGPSRQHLDLRP
jgi:hypothetical protein